MPFFYTIDIQASFAGIREIFFHKKPYRFRFIVETGGLRWEQTKPRAWALLSTKSQ
jgi:hypothetical protein